MSFSSFVKLSYPDFEILSNILSSKYFSYENEFGNKGLEDLCEGLIGSSVEILNLGYCEITNDEQLKSILDKTKIKKYNI